MSTIPEKMKSYCSTCNRPTNQHVLYEHEIKDYDEEGGWWEETRYQIIRCAGCDAISFRKCYNDVQQQSYVDAGEDGTSQELYPSRGYHSRPLKKYRGLPEGIQDAYQETIEAFNGGQALLAGIGLRAIVEGICGDKGITEGKVRDDASGVERTSKKLDGKIAGLVEKGWLAAANAEALHELRFLGNESAHALHKPPLKELSQAIDIIELSIDTIYQIRKATHRLRESRKSRKK
jgi:uncharacterized protein DUF4145